MKLKTTIKAGALNFNHNEKIVRTKIKKVTVRSAVKTGLRAGSLNFSAPAHSITANHNETLVRR